MNSIELQLWKNAELKREKELTDDIKWREQNLANRQKFVEHLDLALGAFFVDLIAGPISKHSMDNIEHYVPITFHGMTGEIQSSWDGSLVIKMGTEIAHLGQYALGTPEKIADWLERWTKQD